MKTDDSDVEMVSALDDGIRWYVVTLRSQGIETFESCQGGPGHAFPEPTIRFHGNAFEGYRAFTAAMNYGLPVLSLRCAYDVNEMRLEGPWWEMTFKPSKQPAESLHSDSTDEKHSNASNDSE